MWVCTSATLTMGGVHWLATALLLSSIAVHGTVGDIGYPQTDSWICLTTSGGNPCFSRSISNDSLPVDMGLVY